MKKWVLFAAIAGDDDGKSWSPPYSITAQVKNPKWHICFNGPGSGIVMEDGTLVFPAQYRDESAKLYEGRRELNFLRIPVNEIIK